MSDNTTLNPGSGGDVIATDDISGVKHQLVKIEFGAADSATQVSTSNPLPISDAGGSLTVDGTVAISGSVPITDNSGSITIDNSTLAVVGGGSESTAMRVTLANDSTGVVSVDDNGTTLSVDDGGGSLTIDGTVAISGTAAVTQSGTWTANIKDGAGNALTSKTVGSEQAISVAIMDGSGTQITSFGGGTEYTEDAAAAANPVGNAIIVVRDDARGGSLVSADGDNVALRGNNNGELYVKHTDAIPITDNSGSITVDGTVAISGTVAVTDNSGSLTVDNPALSVTGGGVEATALRVTIASDSTGVVSIDDNGASLTVDGTVAISGTVTVASHAVTNAGTFAVQASSVIPGTSATNLGKAEDAAASSGDVGVLALGVRQDTDSSPVSADGDYQSMLFDANGNLKVNIKAGAGSGGTAATDDSSFTTGAGSGTPAMGIVSTDAVTSGDVGVVGMLGNRQLKVTLFDSGGSELSVGGGTQYTEDAAAAANPVGNALIMVRDDSRAGSLVSANGDNVAVRGTNAGELYVKHVDSIPITDGSGSLTVDNPALSETGGGTEAGVLRVTIATDSTGVLSIDDNGGSLTVDGTVAATQSGTWNVSNISGTITLPTGAATVAKQPALGTAGSASADVISVQGIASMTPLKVDGSGVTQPVSGTFWQTTQPVSGTFWQTTQPVSGTFWQTTQPVSLASAITVKPDASVWTLTGTSANVNVTNGLTSYAEDAASSGGEDGLQILAVRRDTASSGVSADGDFAAVSVTSTGALRVTDDGAATPYKNLDCDESEDDIKTSPARLFWIHVINLTASKRYLKFYNDTAANVTVGTTTPVLTFPIPTMGDTNGAGFTINFGTKGVNFSVALCVAATTGFADNDTGAPGTNDVILNAGYL